MPLMKLWGNRCLFSTAQFQNFKRIKQLIARNYLLLLSKKYTFLFWFIFMLWFRTVSYYIMYSTREYSIFLMTSAEIMSLLQLQRSFCLASLVRCAGLLTSVSALHPSPTRDSCTTQGWQNSFRPQRHVPWPRIKGKFIACNVQQVYLSRVNVS